MEDQKYNAYFMRKPNLVGKQYSYQDISEDLTYKQRIYFQFIINKESGDWISEKSETHECYLKHDLLKTTLNNNGYNGTEFIDNIERVELLDLSNLTLEQLMYHVDYSVEKEIADEVI